MAKISIVNPRLEKVGNWGLTSVVWCGRSVLSCDGRGVRNLLEIMARGDAYQVQGQQGGIVLSGADSAVGDFRWIQVLADAEIVATGSGTAGNLDNIGDLDSLVVGAGIGIGGRFSKVQIASGVVIAYYA